MLATRTLLGDIATQLRAQGRALLVFHLFFTVLATAVLVPLTTWTLTSLLHAFHRQALSNAQIADMALSPLGLAWGLVALGLSFLLIFLQQSGMMRLVAAPGPGRYLATMNTLWQIGRRFPSIAGLTFLQVGAHLLLVAPFVLLIAYCYDALLGDAELYVVMRMKPPALWHFATLGGGLALIALWCQAWLYARWFLALPALVLDRLPPLQALARSRALTRGRHTRITALALTFALGVAALPVLFSILFNSLASPLISHLPDRISLLIPVMLVYVAAYTLSIIAVTFLGVAANSLLVANLYRRLGGSMLGVTDSPAPTQSGWWAWTAEAVLLVFALLQAGWVLSDFQLRDDVAVTAHRGSSMAAPENTLAAMRQAIQEGADYLELDVRLLRDGNVVLSHDRTLERLTGQALAVNDLTLEETRDIDIGSWFGDDFSDERLATLDQVIGLAHGKSRLYVELKPSTGNEQALIEAVVERLRRYGIADSAVIASLSPTIIRDVEDYAPDIDTTLFVQFLLPGALTSTPADIIGLRHTRADAGTVNMVHDSGRELHIWTVNSARDMSRYIDMGVDNIITDRPATLIDLLTERATLSDGELLLLKLRNWLHQ
ncbi:glycerophosphodiester phosphodiesterase [Chromohalobacter canadensis]|uniref:Glycerophosphodiester phosphodiesterase n=1 Tax=Chromohalobacter canadensis TaxID=141389 RepID=A0A285VW04_9GAMM|nr:glycerophosphodiester phosphodiesterase [Chromohalobacter canadensis]MCK0768815.1 glycerophosphodiester phosphodiesterase [Chromohalobacter canadensis]WQH09314.1 glycerophosphodiester phosphodiesterase [Chromohalobacter canadensis]SOC58202.1 glycerophosphoryl diester phosphodiesterase [Chromohalobacter canadensis]